MSCNSPLWIEDRWPYGWDVPCGKCRGCKMDWSLTWAIRCMHEAQMHDVNSFVTLTYDDEHLPADGKLSPPEAKQFIRRLVKRTGSPVRFFLGGEYGSFGRPHYHAILFGVGFADRLLFKAGAEGRDLYRSRMLEELWPLGFSTVGSVTFSSASYVAQYCVKKQNVTSSHFAPFVRMSRKPGIGRSWLERYATDVYPRGSVVIEGKEVKSPRYYDEWLKSVRPFDHEALRQERLSKRKPVVPARLRDRETILAAELERKKRNL